MEFECGGYRSSNNLAITSDLTRLAFAEFGAMRIWDIESGECLHCLQGRRDNGTIGAILCTTFSQDSARLAAALYHTISVYSVGSGELLQTLNGHNSDIYSMAFSNDSTRLISASYDCTVKIWDVSSGKYPTMLASTVEGHREMVNAVAFSYDSTQLASASYDGTVKLWDISSGECLQTFKGYEHLVSVVAFSSYDSTQLVSGSYDGMIMVWDTGSGECLWTLKGHCAEVCSIALPYKQNRLASVSTDRTVKVWDLSSGTNIHTFDGPENYTRAVAFSHDLTRLALAVDDIIWIWDASCGKHLQKLKGHSRFASSVAFSCDSTRLASSSDDNTVRIWDASSYGCLQILNIGRALDNISFDTSGSYLHTDIGTFALDAPLASKTKPDQIERQTPVRLGVGLSPNGKWITYNSEKLVWLPSEYRPYRSAVSESSRTIGISARSRKTWMCTLEIPSHEQ